jgi:hypothetical protein
MDGIADLVLSEEIGQALPKLVGLDSTPIN